jgi:4-amino-4-deoxy-L-arabinose transferase-like glycosyltransferase
LPQVISLTHPRPCRPLLWILLAGALVRVGLLLWFQGEPLRVFDEGDYNELAVNLVLRGEYVLQEQTSSMRPPLYPFVVAAVYRCCGLENYQAVRALQAVVALATVVLVYLLGREVYNRRIGLWAAGLYGFYPSMLGQANLLLTETIFAFWVALACLLAVRFLRRETIGHLVLAGVVIGLASLTRSVFWLLPPVLAVYVLAASSVRLPRRILAAGLMLTAFAATIAPWSIRCSRLEETFVAIDAMGGRNLMMGNYDHTPTFRAWDAISIQGEQSWYRVLRHDGHPEFRNLTQGQRDKLALRYGLRYMAEHPGQTAGRSLVKFFNFWQLDRSLVAGMGRGWFGDLPKPAILVAALLLCGGYALAMFCGIFGAVMAPPADRRVFFLILLVIAYVCGLHVLTFAHSRYHLPLAPLEMVFAAAAVVHRRAIWRRRRTRSFLLAAGLCLVLVGGWVFEIVAADWERVLQVLRV